MQISKSFIQSFIDSSGTSSQIPRTIALEILLLIVLEIFSEIFSGISPSIRPKIPPAIHNHKKSFINLSRVFLGIFISQKFVSGNSTQLSEDISTMITRVNFH